MIYSKGLSQILGLFFLLFLAIACKKNKSSDSHSDVLVIDYYNTKEMHFEEYFNLKDIKIIQFAYSDTLILSDKLYAKMVDSSIFVHDAVTVQIYRFNQQGELINKIGTSGLSPAEYSDILDFDIDTIEKTVDILCNRGKTVKTYGYDGVFRKKFETPKVAFNFNKVNDNCYWFFSGFVDPTGYRLHLCDTLKVVRSYLNLKTKILEFTEQKFFGVGGEGLFRESFLPSIYEYNSTTLTERFRIDFGKNTVSEDELRRVSDPSLFFEEQLQKGTYTTIQACKGAELASIRTLYQKGEDQIDICDFIIDSRDNSATKIINTKLTKQISPQLSLIRIDSNNNFYYLTSPVALSEFLLEIVPKDKNLEFNKNGNPLVVVLNRE